MKRQLQSMLQSNLENIASISTARERRRMPRETSQSATITAGKSMAPKILAPKNPNIRLHKTASIGGVEDLLQCPICKDKLKSPKMMPCQHTFCLQCLKNHIVILNKEDGSFTCPVCNATFESRAPENLSANIHVEMLLNIMTGTKKERNIPKNTVSFAPLPPKIRNRELSPTLKCRGCGEAYEYRCKHCKRGYCYECWTSHVNDLKEELNSISADLETSTAKFEDRISNFRNKANEMKDFINRDIAAKIAELNKKRENRIKRIELVVAMGEASVEDIKRRMQKAQVEITEQKEVSYDLLPDNKQKVKTFLDLQQKAAEIAAAIAIWELELNDIEMGLGKVIERGASFIKETIGPLYKRKTFTPKIIVNHDMVQRPSALTVDSWRDHIIATCPGSGQVVILDRKFKVIRRIRHQEMMAPQGVAFLQKNDEIYVTDKWKHCIFIFDHKGEFVRRMCNKGQGESQLRSPEGITFHPEQSILYVADTGNDRIQVLEKDGAYLCSIGPTEKRTRNTIRVHKIGPISSQLNQPTDVAVTMIRVAVADSGSHKIKIFDHEGQILQTIGGIGTSKGLFKSPEVLRIDKKGNIIVGDAGNGRVQIFSPEGEFLRVIGGKGTKEHQFGWVSGVLVTNNYDIFIADSKNNVIYLL